MAVIRTFTQVSQTGEKDEHHTIYGISSNDMLGSYTIPTTLNPNNIVHTIDPLKPIHNQNPLHPTSIYYPSTHTPTYTSAFPFYDPSSLSLKVDGEQKLFTIDEIEQSLTELAEIKRMAESIEAIDEAFKRLQLLVKLYRE